MIILFYKYKTFLMIFWLLGRPDIYARQTKNNRIFAKKGILWP